MAHRINTKIRKNFRERLSDIDDYIPGDYQGKILRQRPEWNANRIVNVRFGRTVDLDILEYLEELAMTVKEKLEK